jgi:hypothetical protein
MDNWNTQKPKGRNMPENQNPNTEYFIIDRRPYSPNHTGQLFFWRAPLTHPGNCKHHPGSRHPGFTTDLSLAGRYTRSQIAAHPTYYDNPDTMPVPCALVEAVAVKVVPIDCLRPFEELRAGKVAQVVGQEAASHG